ncbi:hypothetical protein GCM10009865_43430 [Aeromicrobium ponti]|uniref:Uncharacterized protein n=1 Tax=Cytobacillus oceanisediminis TaxID=665099 RepID=A0A562JCJ6_9BACI|nr:hypothetical protein [Cytobacillus oceanisediminis]TWH80860.1 hypothetical protein IQ19_04605 [Cytobacillus oceanisediminis]
MKKMEVLMSILLIVLGLVCLTMSGSMMFQQDLSVYIKTFVQICLWMGVPILLAGVSYLLLIKKRR